MGVSVRLTVLAVLLASACGSEDGGGSDAGGSTEVHDDGGVDASDASDASDAADAPDEMATTPLPPPGPGFHRDGRWLLDADGRVVLLHGANVSNHAKNKTDHLTWHEPADMVALAEAGFDSMRLVTGWAAVMPEPGVVDEAYLEAYAERVGWAADAGMLVVLDMHQDVFGYGFGGNGAPRWACDEALYAAHEPQSPWFLNYGSPQVMACFDHFYADDATFDLFVDAWVALAGRFAGHPAVIGFDLLNEPHWGTTNMLDFGPDVWQPRQEQLAAAIHEVAPDQLVFFEGPPIHGVGASVDFVPPVDPQIAFAPHYYDPILDLGGPYDFDSAPSMSNAMDAIALTARNLGDPPTWVGEFGCPSPDPDLTAFMRDILPIFAARGWGWAVWSDDLGNGGFNLRDPEGNFRPELLAVLSHPRARRLPGPPAEQELSFDPPRYRVRFPWLVAAPVELWAGAADDGASPSAKLAPVDAPDETLSCDGDGLVVCPDDLDAIRYGELYELVIEAP